MKIILITCVFLISNLVYAQKKKIQFETYKEWQTVGNGGLSNDGKFAFYTISNQPIGGITFILQSTDNSNNSKKYQGISNAKFSANSKYLIGTINYDSLFILTLKTNEIKKIPNVSNFNLIASKNGEKLCYKNNSDNNLYIKDLENLIEAKYPNVLDYKIGNMGDLIVLKQEKINSNHKSEVLTLTNFISGSKEIIFEGNGISTFIIDSDDKQISWLIVNDTDNSIWNYVIKENRRTKLVDAQSLKIAPSYNLTSQNFRYSKDGNNIFYSQGIAGNLDLYQSKEDLIIWNYRDSYLRSYYDGNRNIYDIDAVNYLSKVNILSGKTTRLVQEKEYVMENTFNDSLIIIKSSFGRPEDATFIPSARITYFTYNINSGKKNIFEKDRTCQLFHMTTSPNGKYIVYYDPQANSYISYNITTEEKLSITANIDYPFTNYSVETSAAPEYDPIGVIGWIDNGNKILINGRFDIWAIDPSNRKPPLNLTRNIGRTEQTIFSVPLKVEKSNFNSKQTIVLYALNLKTKELGYYKVKLSGIESPVKLSMSATYNKGIEKGYYGFQPDDYIETTDHKKHLILRQSVDNAPNYYFSKDLVSFKQISNIQPQKNYNWLTSELHSYTDSIGNNYSGILYKPEDFDQNKKYPILFMYYIELSNLLNSFPSVELVPANFNIPYAVSNGYLVFLPDMKSTPGKFGQGALTSILSAVNHLNKYNWVDTSKMGIAGHSFGGLETNYIVANTNIFKAAISGAADCEIISIPYDVWPGSGLGYQLYLKTNAPKMGKTLAEDPSIYIKNSPLLKVKDITTPMLLLQNNNDAAIPVRQAIQLFSALRSLQKPVWWLNYINEQHAIADPKLQLDYNIKSMEFFDYYLKGSQEPEWMKKHI